MVENAQKGDILVDSYSAAVIFQYAHSIAQRGWNPAATLIKELGDGLGSVSVRVGGGAILDLVALFYEESRQPTVLAQIVKYELVGVLWSLGE